MMSSTIDELRVMTTVLTYIGSPFLDICVHGCIDVETTALRAERSHSHKAVICSAKSQTHIVHLKVLKIFCILYLELVLSMTRYDTLAFPSPHS